MDIANPDGRNRVARSRMEARLWMAFTLAGVLFSCLTAFVMVPVRAAVFD